MRWEQRGDLPAATLHTPFVDADTGSISDGALIVLRWQDGGEG
jgi:hypothetical protein